MITNTRRIFSKGWQPENFLNKLVFKLFKNIYMDHPRVVGHCVQTLKMPRLKIILIVLLIYGIFPSLSSLNIDFFLSRTVEDGADSCLAFHPLHPCWGL